MLAALAHFFDFPLNQRSQTIVLIAQPFIKQSTSLSLTCSSTPSISQLALLAHYSRQALAIAEVLSGKTLRKAFSYSSIMFPAP